MFTSEYPTPNFNFHTFEKLNAGGRLLIVLDGFDEMKHAMSWTDFRSQIRDLNRLTKGDARVVLLGRPTAFLSYDEHLLVLRGMQKVGAQMRQNIDWPKFDEYELCDFVFEEAMSFIQKYLPIRLREEDSTEKNVSDRIVEVTKIVEADQDLFAKPVHLRILVDLAADLNVNLGRFEGGLSRWDLYQVFFSDLSDRESEKEARRPISSDNRLDFLRDLAFWLWNRKDGQISFEASEVPAEIFDQGDDTPEKVEVAQREFLTGAFIEKKGEETFFFGHRSFVEFLVADFMVRNPPRGQQYSRYATLVKDGVAQFLTDFDDISVFEQWVEDFDSANGSIPLEFLVFLQLRLGEKYDLRVKLPQRFAISVIYRAYVPDTVQLFAGDLDLAGAGFLERLDLLLRTCPSEFFCEIVEFRLSLDGEIPQQDHQGRAEIYAGLLLERVFRDAEVDVKSRKTLVSAEADLDRRIASLSFSKISNEADDRYVNFDWEGILDWAHSDQRSRRQGPTAELRESEGGYVVAVHNRLRWSNVLAHVESDVREKVRSHFRFSNTIDDVVTREVQRSRKRRQGA